VRMCKRTARAHGQIVLKLQGTLDFRNGNGNLQRLHGLKSYGGQEIAIFQQKRL